MTGVRYTTSKSLKSYLRMCIIRIKSEYNVLIDFQKQRTKHRMYIHAILVAESNPSYQWESAYDPERKLEEAH